MRNTRKISTLFAAAAVPLLSAYLAAPVYAAEASSSSSSNYSCIVASDGYYFGQSSASAETSSGPASSATSFAYTYGNCQQKPNEKPVTPPAATDGEETPGEKPDNGGQTGNGEKPDRGETPDNGKQPGNSEESGNSSELEPETSGGSSNTASSAVSVFSAAYLMSCAETTTLHQRLGDLRAARDGGVWFRVHGGKFESAAKSFVREFDMKYGGVQAGYDRKLKGMDGQMYVGAMFGYAKGDLEYLRSGKGEVDSKTAGVYATYSHANGMYADMTLKYQWMDNKFDVLDTASGRVTGDSVRTGGPGASLEVGKRFNIGAAEKEGWYLEPHARLSYSRQSGGTFRASNGLNISVDGFTSLIGRAGVTIGYDNGRTNLFFKAAREKEFDGDVTIIANGERITEDFGGSRWLFGVGVTSKLNDRNSLYLTVDRTEGDSFVRPWEINAGLRITL